jgi:TonB family protein
MAVQIVNDMPDAEVHRGEPLVELLHELNARRARRPRLSGRAGILGITIALHAVAGLAFMQIGRDRRAQDEAPPIIAAFVEAPAQTEEAPPEYIPPPMNVAYSMPTPQDLSFETETAITTEFADTAITTDTSSLVPPMIETVEYLRATPPVYPRESQRRREYGTVILRILVDADGRPAQIRIERSSGHERLDAAARKAAENFLFRPYEVNGIRQAAQVRIPIGFDPPAKS